MSGGPDSAILVTTTFPEAELARSVVHALVGERLAACGTIVPDAESIYTWKGGIETGRECLVIFKTMRSCYTALEQRLRQMHPYEVPEIVAVDVVSASPRYLEWVAESCGVSVPRE